MFEFIRTHQRLMQIFLALLIIPSFLFFGNVSSDMFKDPVNLVATVGKRSITQQEWDNALNQEMNQARQSPTFDQARFESPENKQRVLNGLIEKQVLQAAIDDKHLVLNDEVLIKRLMEIPGLVGEDGKFNNKQYVELLKQQGLTPAGYEASYRRDVLQQQLSQAIQGTAMVPGSVANRIADIIEQEREVQELLIKTTDFTDKVKVTDAMVKDYYDKNSKKFEIADQVKAEYLVFNSDAVASMVNVPEAEVKANYDNPNSKARFTQLEQRRASHILLNVKKDGSDRDKVKAAAQALLDKVRKNPADFAKLAKENSDDKGSGEKGGDLDFFGRGMMVAPFEEAAYKMKKGEISDLVLSEYGYHIIMLSDIKPESVKPFEEVKAQILDEMKRPLVSKKFSDLSTAFSEAVEDRSESLQAAADKLKKDKLDLKVETVAALGRVPNPGMAPGTPYNHVKFLAALFSDDSIKSKRNTPAIEVAPGVLVAGRILEYKPVALRPLAEVQDNIRALLARMEADKSANTEGKAKLVALKAKPDDAGFAASKRISLTKPPEINPAAVQSVMKADVSKLPAFVGVELPGQGYGVYRINKVEASATPDLARRQAMPQQLSASFARQEMGAFVDVLKEKAKVKVLRPAVASASASASASGSASASSSASAK